MLCEVGKPWGASDAIESSRTRLCTIRAEMQGFLGATVGLQGLGRHCCACIQTSLSWITWPYL